MDKKRKLFRRDDLFLIGIVLAVGVIVGVWVFVNRDPGQMVVITVGSEEVASLPLDTDTVYRIASGTDGYNILVIQDGEVWIEESNCSGQDCVYMGKISSTSECIICLPHGVLVQIEE